MQNDLQKPEGSTSELGSRKDKILSAVVRDHVETGDPIGSEWLLQRYDFGCRSATLRNEMSEMAEMGYLLQPHTSAGRVPSSRGYRYFVDALMPPATAHFSVNLPVDLAHIEINEVVRLACRSLAQITGYPSVATSPVAQARGLQRIFLSPASARRVLLVMLFTTGQVEHTVLSRDYEFDEDDLHRLSRKINHQLLGTDECLGTPSLDRSGEDALIQPLFQEVALKVESIRKRMVHEQVFLEGTNQMLKYREFQDLVALERVLSVLEERSALIRVFQRAIPRRDVAVCIGDEISVNEMSHCSIVMSRYGDAHMQGFIGLLGPIRMRYESVVPAVGYMARQLTMLTSHVAIE